LLFRNFAEVKTIIIKAFWAPNKKVYATCAGVDLEFIEGVVGLISWVDVCEVYLPKFSMLELHGDPPGKDAI